MTIDATTVDITEPLVFAPPKVRVYTSPTLTAAADGWTRQPFLRCDSLDELAGPGIDEAILSYEVGEFSVREKPTFDEDGNGGQIAIPSSATSVNLLQFYCKVEEVDEDGSILKTWYGVVELDSLDPARNQDQVVSGTQTMRAFGLLRLLEQTQVASSRIEGTDGEPITIGRGLAFNADSGGPYPVRGNRSEETSSDYDGYVFSDEPRGQQLWDGTRAIQYLLQYHSPTNGNDDPAGEWVLVVSSQNVLDWYDITVQTERRTVKSIIDEICDRRRLSSYRVYGEEDAGTFYVYLEVFTFAEEDLDLPDGKTLSANPNQIELNYIDSPLVFSNRLIRTQVHATDRIIVEGEYVTSLATFDADDLEEGWNTDQQTEYLAGDNDGSDEVANAAARSRDAMRDVFSRFVAAEEWDQTVEWITDSTSYFVTIPYDDLPDEFPDAQSVQDAFLNAYATAGNWWYRGKRFQRRLPIQDEESDEYRLPFVLFQEPDSDPEVYRFAEHLSVGGDEGDARNFACTVHVLDDDLGVRVRVNRAGAQQLIASAHWTGAAETKEADDPTVESNQAVNFNTMLTTASVEWDERVRYEKIINEVEAGAHQRTRRIFVRDARLDIELPGTVTDVDADGSLIESEGRAIRDDRQRLKEIGEASAAWYGTSRLAIAVDYGSSRPKVEIGQLVTKLNGDDANTVITRVSYNFRDPGTSLETSFVEADFT